MAPSMVGMIEDERSDRAIIEEREIGPATVTIDSNVVFKLLQIAEHVGSTLPN